MGNKMEAKPHPKIHQRIDDYLNNFWKVLGSHMGTGRLYGKSYEIRQKSETEIMIFQCFFGFLKRLNELQGSIVLSKWVFSWHA